MITLEKTATSGEVGRKDAAPDYLRQLREEIIRAVVTGNYRTGERLPTVQELADQLDISASTVSRVYKELNDDGVLNGKLSLGTFAADPPESVLLEFGETVISPLVRDLRRWGYSEALVLKLTQRAIRRWYVPRTASERRNAEVDVPNEQRRPGTARRKKQK